MATKRPPVDAKSAKKKLRVYAVASPVLTLAGGWCSLLVLAWLVFPAGLVDHIPTFVKAGASLAAACWFVWLFRTFQRLPALIDDILDRGLSLNHEPTSEADEWLGGPGRRR